MSPVLQAASLHRSFGSVVAVQGLDLTLEEGEILGLLGPNGAGKTTTIRMLLGLLRPLRGAVTLLGQPVRPGCSALGQVGALVEGPAFYPWLSGRRNLEVALACRGLPRRERRRRALEVAAVLDLDGCLERPYRTYSTGQRRRLGIAAALAPRPRLLVLDEPTAGLDPVATVALRDLLLRLAREEGRAILLSSHLLGDVEALAQQVVLLDAGVVVRRGALTTLLEDAGVTVGVELGDPTPRALARAQEVAAGIAGVDVVGPEGGELRVRADRAARQELVVALVAAGLPPVAVVPRRRTLEDLFIEELGS